MKNILSIAFILISLSGLAQVRPATFQPVPGKQEFRDTIKANKGVIIPATTMPNGAVNLQQMRDSINSRIAGAGTGSVTSIGLTVPTGLTGASTITTSGTFNIGLASGYSIPTTTNQSNWSTAYGWGNHAIMGYLTAITSGQITGALGFTPLATRSFGTAANSNTGDFTPAAHAGATGSAHGAVTTSVNGFMTSTDKSKLDGVATSAINKSQADTYYPAIVNSVTPSQLSDSIRSISGGTLSIGYSIIPSNFDFTAANTAYQNKTWVITYNHTITGNVTLPAGVTLRFMGGSISGITTLTGNNTKIIADDVNIISATTIAGTWTADKVWLKWLGAKGDATTDDYAKGQQLLDWAFTNQKMKVYIGVGKFRVASNGLTVRTDFEGQSNITYGTNSTILNNTSGAYGIRVFNSAINISNFTVEGNATGANGAGATCGDGVFFDGTAGAGLSNLTVKNITSWKNTYGMRFTAGVWISTIYDCVTIQNRIDGVNVDSGDGYPTNYGQKNSISFIGGSSGINGRNGFTIWGLSIRLFGIDMDLNLGAGIALDSQLSTNRTVGSNCYNTTIIGCHFEGNGHGALYATGGLYNGQYFYVRGLIMENCYTYHSNALFKDGWTNTIKFESFGGINENSGPIGSVRITNNTFAGDHSVYCNFNNMLDALSYIDLPTDSHYINFGRAANPNQYRTLVVSGYFYGKGVAWTNVLRSENVASGTVVQFPITLPSNCNINQYKVWVQTDATNYSVEFNTVARDASAGI